MNEIESLFDGLTLLHIKILQLLEKRGCSLDNQLSYYGAGFSVNVLDGKETIYFHALEAGSNHAQLCVSPNGCVRFAVYDCSREVSISNQDGLTFEELFLGEYPHIEIRRSGQDVGSIKRGDITLCRLCYNCYPPQTVTYTKQLSGDYKTENETGGELSHLSLPEKFEKTKYVRGLPIGNLINIDLVKAIKEMIFESKADVLIRNLDVTSAVRGRKSIKT